MSLKILIDPSYVSRHPVHLVPRLLRYHGLPGGGLASGRWGTSHGFCPRAAFGKGGFDGMDLGIAYTPLLRPDLTVREEALARYKRIAWPIHALHATFMGGSPYFAETAMQLTEDGPRTRRGLRNQIRIAAELAGRGAILVLHAGKVTGSPEQGLRVVRGVLEGVLPLAEEKGVVLALENMPRSVAGAAHLGGDYRELQALLGALPSPCLKVCFDWGHANNYAEVFAGRVGRRDVEAYLAGFGYCREMVETLGTEIVYAHVHYNRSHVRRREAMRRNLDEHLPLHHVPASSWEAFRESLSALLRLSSVRISGRINLELPPRRVFGALPVHATGSARTEQVESLALLRSLFEGVEGRAA